MEERQEGEWSPLKLVFMVENLERRTGEDQREAAQKGHLEVRSGHRYYRYSMITVTSDGSIRTKEPHLPQILHNL